MTATDARRLARMKKNRALAARTLPRPAPPPPAGAPAPETFSLPTAATRAGCTLRRTRYYLEAGLLPPARKRGPGARYDEAFVHRLMAIEALRAKRMLLEPIRQLLAKSSPEKIRDLAGIRPPAPPPAVVVKEEPKPKPPAPITYKSERWERIVLVPGLSLVVESDSAGLRRLAQQIVDAFGSG
jgi:DNA-binding transcriptional MerR regulator